MSKGESFNRIKASDPYHWISSGKIDLPKTSSHYRNAAKNGIIPKSQLTLP
jgi:hypothetical protein